jgi:hypothetical protein
MKSPKTKTNLTVTKSLKMRRPFIFLVALIILAAAFFAIQTYNRYLDTKDRERFEVLKADVETVLKKIEMTSGVREGWKLDWGCSMPGNVFGGGTPTCDSSIRLEKKIATIKVAVGYIEKLNKSIKDSSQLFSQRSQTYLKEVLPQSIDVRHSDYATYTHIKTNINCSSGLTISARDKHDGYDLIIQFGCYDNARQLHF